MTAENSKGGQLTVIGVVIVLAVVLIVLANQNKEVSSLKARINSIETNVAQSSLLGNKISAVEEKLAAVEFKINLADSKILAVENTFKNLSQAAIAAPVPEPENIVEVPVPQP